MKRLISIAGLLIAAVVAIAATTHTPMARSTGTHSPTKASLMNAYVEAAQYWQSRPVSVASALPATPPTTASLMNAYVAAAQYWQQGSSPR
jgi:hypothetical protein